MNFIYISPHFPEVHEKFCLALQQGGLTVLGIGDAPYDSLTPSLKAALSEYYQVESLADYGQVFRAVAWLSFKHGKIDWLESNNEFWLEQDARLRSDFNITTGIQADCIQRFKSKALMKELFAAHGIPTARQCKELECSADFALEVGFPLIAKPEVGVGALDTYLLRDIAELTDFLRSEPPQPYVIEEYIQGDIVSFDGLVDAQGKLCFAAAVEFPPSVLDIVTAKLDLCYTVSRQVPPALFALGQKTVAAFQVRNRFIHLEFFRLWEDHPSLGKKGDFVALEVNMRPAGGNTPDMYNYASNRSVFDLYAELVCQGGVAAPQYEHPYYCTYASRRDEFSYLLSHEQLLHEYGDELSQFGRNPGLLAPQMGNYYYLLRTASAERVRSFTAAVSTRA